MSAVLGAVLAALAVAALLAAALPGPRALRPARAELDFIRDSTLETPPAARSRDPALRVLRAVSRRLRLREGPVTRRDLVEAGLDPDSVSPEEVLALKLLLAVAAATATALLGVALAAGPALAPAAAWLGFVTPSLWLRARRRRRQARILAELPDLAGLLRAFVGAGLSLEQALDVISAQLVAGDPSAILAGELRRVLAEFGLGQSIDAGLAEMAERLGTDELATFAAALAQGRRLGTGLEVVLRDQEMLLRLSQRNRATAAASQVSTRMMGVLVGIYLPEFMLLIVVPLMWGVMLRAFG